MTAAIATQETTQFLSFFIGGDEYGLRILESREIIQYPTVTKVPSMPAAIRGVINLRGSVVPVVDLAAVFGFPEQPTTKWTCVVVVETRADGAGSELIGIVVDSVSQVIELRADEIEPPPSFGTQVKQQFLRGMGKTGKTFVLILDLERLLADIAVDATSIAAEDGVLLPADEAPPVEAPAP